MKDERQHLSAFTPVEYTSSYPPYISVNFQNNQVELTVRSEGGVHTATIRLSWQDFWETMSNAAMQFQMMRGQTIYPIVMPSMAMKKQMQDLKAEQRQHPFD